MKTYLERGEYANAVLYLKETIEAAHYKSAFIVADLAWAYYRAGWREKALNSLNDAYADDPKYSLSYFYYGRMMLEKGDLGRAEQAFQKAISLYPAEEMYREYLEKARN